jgi:predicted RNase H-like nuclease
MTWVAGVDACKGGWFVVARDLPSGRTVHAYKKTFAEVLSMRESPRIVAVDIPIGLPEKAHRGGRACDREARRIVGARRMSVFSPPVRAALGAATWKEADAANRASSPDGVGLSRQSWALIPKIVEVDRLLTKDVRQRVRECFPESSFAAMAGRPMTHAKRGVTGIMDRSELLMAAGFPDPLRLRGGWPTSLVAIDDILDAHACCWTAQRIFEGGAVRLPVESPPEHDRRGLPMEIWY